MTTEVPSAILTPADVLQRARQRITLYDPQHSGRSFDAFGRIYHSSLETGEFVVEDLERHPRRKDLSGKVRTIMDELELDPDGAAPKVVAQLLERYQHQGLIVLVGDGRDEDRKREARERYIAWQLDYCQGIESAWIAKVAAFTAAQPGAPPPRQTRVIREALAFLERYRSGRLNRKAFICTVCSNEYDRLEGPDGIQQHISIAHPGLSDGEGILRTPQAAPEPAAVGQPGAPADPGDNVGVAGAGLLKEAKKLKVDLTKAELVGLIEDDEQVVNQVIRKLAEVKAKKK